MNGLDAFIADFAGYGNPSAAIWFVGMEEGSGKGVPELARRVDAWSIRGRRPLEDLAAYHRAIDLGQQHFNKPVALQRTWGPLLRALLAWRGTEITLDEMRATQADDLGSERGDSSLIELLPLPSPGTKVWPYESLAPQIAALQNRATYAAAFTSPRIEMLRGLIRKAEPRAVVLYGLRYMNEWTAIVGSALERGEMEGRPWFSTRVGGTSYAAVPHPVAHGTTSRYWEMVGRRLREGTS